MNSASMFSRSSTAVTVSERESEIRPPVDDATLRGRLEAGLRPVCEIQRQRLGTAARMAMVVLPVGDAAQLLAEAVAHGGGGLDRGRPGGVRCDRPPRDDDARVRDEPAPRPSTGLGAQRQPRPGDRCPRPADQLVETLTCRRRFLEGDALADGDFDDGHRRRGGLPP